MELLSDWKAVLKRAWSVRFMVAAALLSGFEVALPFLEGLLSVPRGAFAMLSGLTTAAAFISRFVAQKGLSKK